MAKRIYRDPVHDIISLDQDSDPDRLLIALIDAREFQRLRRIRQLGLALYTYQGAEHSRFVHSLGVMHLMRRVIALLDQQESVDHDVKVVAVCAALLHDIGHGPFSHLIESLLGYHHERWSAAIISDPQTEIHQLLDQSDAGLPQKIVAVIEHRYAPRFVAQLLSSQLDVDRFDYLLRDSMMTGAKYGVYDLEWILHALELDRAEDHVFVSAKGLYAVEEYLQARYYMFRQVYFHRSLRVGHVILQNIFRRAIELNKSGDLRFTLEETAMGKLLHMQPLTTEEFLQLDDCDIIFFVKQWTQEKDQVLSDLSNRFLHRRLFKSIDLELEDNVRSAFVQRARQVVAAAGFDPEYYLGEDQASDAPYLGPYSPEDESPESRIYISQEDGQRQEITLVSPVVAGMRRFHLHRLCFPESVDETMHALYRQARMDNDTRL